VWLVLSVCGSVCGSVSQSVSHVLKYYILHFLRRGAPFINGCVIPSVFCVLSVCPSRFYILHFLYGKTLPLFLSDIFSQKTLPLFLSEKFLDFKLWNFFDFNDQ
jgi:hypothetical protein